MKRARSKLIRAENERGPIYMMPDDNGTPYIRVALSSGKPMLHFLICLISCVANPYFKQRFVNYSTGCLLYMFPENVFANHTQNSTLSKVGISRSISATCVSGKRCGR
jgi:hypothetical protein